MRFRFHLAREGRSPDTIWLQKKLTHDGAFAGRKLSSMTVLCSMYREHIAKNTGHSVKAGHAMRTRAPFSSLGHRCSFVSSNEGPETGVNCQLLHRRLRPDTVDPSASKFEKARLCVALREWLLIGMRMQCKEI